MLKIIKRSWIEEMVKYNRVFDYNDMPSAGFSFDSDEHGNVDVDKLQPAGRANYEKCISGEYDVTDRGVATYRWTYRHPSIGLCACGEELELHGDTACNCGREYNPFGQELAPRSQWGEETGENLADIVGPGDPFDTF